ncbi:MAG: RloB family protein [Muribaculaceae bacterium]|nr:RloB family protein [Muribaculaceae bacterium]
MIARRKDYHKLAPSKNANKIYVICEGNGTEPDYYKFFEGLSSNLEIIAVPSEDGHTDPVKLLELAERIFFSDSCRYIIDYMQQDQIWFAIDTDQWEEHGKIDVLREYCSRKNNSISDEYDEVKPYSAWCVAQCNPCFELWLYYHLYDSIKAEDVEQYVTFKQFVDAKITGGFNFQLHPVLLENAITNSELNFQRDMAGKPSLYSTEKFLLGKVILSFCKKELDKLKNKMP